MNTTKSYFAGISIPYSSNEMINAIKTFDSTIEFIGFVDKVCDVEPVRKNQKVFKFLLNNDDGSVIQVKAWDEQIARTLRLIESNAIIHLDGVAAKPVKKMFNLGTTDLEFCIQSNTVINCLGRHQIKTDNVEHLPEKLKLADVGSTIAKIRVEGWVKTPFRDTLHDKTGKFMYMCGSITDGFYKLEVRIQDKTEELTVEKGEPIELTGNMNFKNNSSFFNVDSTKNVIKMKGEKLELKKLLKVSTRIVKRMNCDEIDTSKAKKQKN